MEVEVGASAFLEHEIADADTALAHRSGDVSVVATPRVLALCEEACCLAVHPSLAATTTTVGMRVQLDHVAPVRVGATIRADVTLDRIEGRRLSFTVSVSDASGLVAAGRITRVVVDRVAFMEKAR